MSPATAKFKGNEMTIQGKPLEVGQKAPDFELTATDLSPRRLSDYKGKVKIVSVVLSLDTSTCDTQTRAFNEKASGLDDEVVVLTVSVDLPFAQKRWCGAAGVDRVECLSDYKDHNFGKSWGLRVQELGLLARTVFVVDKDDVIRHIERPDDLSQEPDYEPVLAAAKKLA
ncbi:MAG: thiol peroxidase [Phycisphaeraceae bacterium]